jgi:hypothetical protein
MRGQPNRHPTDEAGHHQRFAHEFSFHGCGAARIGINYAGTPSHRNGEASKPIGTVLTRRARHRLS